MVITKDECRVIAEAIRVSTDHLSNGQQEVDRQDTLSALEIFQKKLEDAAKDMRRTGRTSQDDWYDMIQRFTKRYVNPDYL
jgi:hypothetical protein